MSKKSQWKLTENGVLALYEQHFKKEVRVQVIFKTYIDSTCYLRVSDGQHLSPVVIIMCQMHSHTMFSVGAIIAIKERRLVPFDDYVEDDGPQWFMKDYGVHHLYIERYILVASHTDVGQVLGSLHHNGDYRENMKLMLSVLSKWIPEDEQLQWEHDSNEIHLRQEERDRLREQGNSFFKQNDFNRAIDFYNVAKVEDPYDYRVWSNCSHAYFKLKEYLPAQLHAIVATKLNPFFEKAYYRAGQAALRERRWWDGEEYAKCGIFICGETKELRQILDDSINIPNDNQGGLLDSFITDGIRGFVRNHTESIINSTLESVDLKSAHQKSRCIVRDIQEQFMKKKHADLSGALVKEQKKETKKINKKSKKLGEDVATTSAAAATASTTASGSKEQKSKGEEERKHFQDKKEEKNKKSKINIEETLQEGKRLFQSEQFHQAIEMYSKCLTSNGLTDNRDTVKPSESYNVQVVQLIIGVCKVQSSRGYIFEGLEIMQTLLEPSSKFSHKPACRYWLAISFEKICCFKLAQKHAQSCKDALKKLKNIKPVKWPGTDQLINWTRADVLESECNLLLEKLSSSKPSPKAKCRYKNCITTQGIPYAKDEIYLTDPDFKGYLNVICEEDCTVSYHPCCWKALKEQHDGSINRMSDKDFLGEVCVTPDCTGKISSIQIYDDEGYLKNELVKDKKDRKHMAAPVKQKKKKDKKKEKTQVHKKRTRVESVCEDQATNDDTSPAAADSTSVQNAPTNSNNNSSGSNNNDKHKSSQKPLLPIDPESLEKAQVTILKPGLEAEEVSPTKSTKRNRKKKVKKTVNQPNLLGDPLESDSCVQSEYIARLRMLRQQRDALEAGESPNPMKPIIISCDTQKPVILLDPDNPFYLPQHLRDNPEELERVLQEKLTTSSPPGLQQETINTLLDFMYDWLKSEGPMRTNDPRLAEQVAENFPQEARDYVIQCGGITGLLMQSLKFAMIDNIICVHDDVMKAQEMMCQEVMDKMMQSKYLVRYSDGQKAKRFTHLLDDNKSTCSTTSSSSQPAGSVAESTISRDSAGTVTRWHTNHTRNDDPNNNDNDSESTVSLAPLSKAVVDQFHKFAVCALNPTAPEFEPLVSNDEGKSEDDDDDDDDDDEDEDELKRQYKRKLFDNDENTRQWSKGDCEYIENWAAQAGEKVPIMPTDEDEIEVVQDEEQEEDEEEEEDEEAEEREVVVGEGEEERTKSLQDEEDLEGTEQYISQLLEEKEKLIGDLQNEQQQNQVLSDKLYQVKSQYKSEVMKLKQQLEELKDQNRELTTEKNAIVLQREADTKKFKADLSRMNEEMKATGSRLQSSELKGERFLDQNNELQAKLAEEMELNTQLKEELEKMKNLQESLTSCSRRAREAEVKYLCTKKDLVDASMTSTISRLTEEATAMKQLLPGTTEDSVLDRTTLTRTIVLWDEAIKKLLEHQRIFKDEGTRLLGMIHQGRPLSALPAGDLPIPPIPELNVAPILSRFQNNHHRPSPPTFGVSEVLSMDMPRHSSPGPQGPPHRSKATPPPPIADPSSQVSIMPISLPIIPHGALSGHPLFVHNGGLPPNHASAYASGAIPKSGTSAPPGIQHPKAAEMPCLTQQTESPNQLFVGQLPWEYTEADIKNLFSRFGEVVSVNVFDKGCNADGRPVPKYGFITFRNADDCFKALSARPIYVRNHMLNVQAKEAKKPTKPASVPAPGGGGGVVGGGAGVGGAVGGGGLTGIINEPDATNGTKSSAYGLTDITVNANVEANKSTVLHHHTLPTSPTLHHHQPPPPTTQSVTKPKFQKLLPSNNTVGGIVAPPPKLVRPQPKTVPNASKLGGQAGTSKEENVMPSSSSYTRLIEICKQRFGKEFSSPDICIALREVRAQNNNSLSGLTTEKIVERVRQQLRSRRPSAGAATVAPWAGLTQGPGVKTEPEWQGPSKEEVVKEEQCSICLEPLNTSPNQSLACLHTFHALCINDWIKIQSNCPNCRKFALMPDEYPTLSHN